MKSIAIFIPGIGYHNDKPLLYYSRRMAAQLGYETVGVEYAHMPQKVKGDIERMKEAIEIGYRQTEEALTEYEWTEYERIYLVGKSIGTVIAARYAKEHGLDAKLVLYTPVEATFSYGVQDARAFIGTKDPWSDLGEVIRMAEQSNVELYRYEGCNHSLETDDVLMNIEILTDVMKKTEEFITCENPAFT